MTYTLESPREGQARPLERVYEQVAGLLRDPDVASRLRMAPGESEWSAMQTLGHLTKMIPYWSNHCGVLIAPTGPPRGPAARRVRRSDWRVCQAAPRPDDLLTQLEGAVRSAATAIPESCP